jgi:hypothetical protein
MSGQEYLLRRLHIQGAVAIDQAVSMEQEDHPQAQQRAYQPDASIRQKGREGICCSKHLGASNAGKRVVEIRSGPSAHSDEHRRRASINSLASGFARTL